MPPGFPAADVQTTIVHTPRPHRQAPKSRPSSSAGRHNRASQAHCIAWLPTSRGCGGRPALCPPLMDATTFAANATPLKHVRRQKHNIATPRVEISHLLLRLEPQGGEDASGWHLAAFRGCQSPSCRSPLAALSTARESRPHLCQSKPSRANYEASD